MLIYCHCSADIAVTSHSLYGFRGCVRVFAQQRSVSMTKTVRGIIGKSGNCFQNALPGIIVHGHCHWFGWRSTCTDEGVGLLTCRINACADGRIIRHIPDAAFGFRCADNRSISSGMGNIATNMDHTGFRINVLPLQAYRSRSRLWHGSTCGYGCRRRCRRGCRRCPRRSDRNASRNCGRRGRRRCLRRDRRLHLDCRNSGRPDDKNQAPLLIPVLKIAPEATRPILRAVEERMLPGAIKKR